MFSFFLICSGLVLFLFYNVHYFILLLSLEMILLGVIALFFFIFGEGFYLIDVFLFLLLVACMGGFSISLLVFLFRSVGKDFWSNSYFF